MKKGQVLFDDWSEVKDCNGCENYWNKLCDGTKVGTEKRCTAFKATRTVDMQEEIKSLKERVKWINVSLILCGIALVGHLLSHVLGWV